VCDPRGNEKRRPVVVVTGDDEITSHVTVVAVAVTTTFPDPPPADHVPLPWDPTGRSATRLTRRSAAVCTWILAVPVDDLEPTGGNVPPAVLLEILSKLPQP
jgi:mRNA-degrading endonuclease toxin of MazEF toxin-antitoxin module